MPIEFSGSLLQKNRNQNAGTNSFFHLVDAIDINFSVEKILENGGEEIPSEPAPGTKYIIRDKDQEPGISPANGVLGSGDVVMWDGNNWVIYLDVSNPKTNHGVVFDKRTQKFYQYTPTNGWVPIITGKSSLDGGTF